MTVEMLKNGLVIHHSPDEETFINFKHIVRTSKSWNTGCYIYLSNDESVAIDKETYLMLLERLGN